MITENDCSVFVSDINYPLGGGLFLKKQSNLSRLMSYAGNHKYLLMLPGFSREAVLCLHLLLSIIFGRLSKKYLK